MGFRKLPAGVYAMLLLMGCTHPAAAFDFTVGDTPIKLDSLVTIGGVMRTQKRDLSLIGKPNVTPGLCLRRTSGSPDEGASTTPGANRFGAGKVPAGCATSNTAAITAFNQSPGAFSPNGDNGNLNFDQHDLVQATAKITTDVSTNVAGFNLFARGLYFFDQRYTSLIENHPDTTMSPRHTKFSPEGRSTIGTHSQLLDYFVSRTFDIGERAFSFKLGNQVLNWGESAFLISNSLNTINPANQALLRLPGFDIKELFQPVGMAFISGNLYQGATIEAFYQYNYKKVEIDPVGSFFSTSDTLGAGGKYAMLSFSRAPEDPFGTYRPIDTCSPTNVNPPSQATPCIDSAGLLGSTASRTIYRDYAEEDRRKPRGGGQYGTALKLFLDEFNGGTELSFYFANYHSRLPLVSAFAAKDTCLTDAASLASPSGCGLVTGPGGALPGDGRAAAREPLPVDTVRLLVEYPENIHLFGVSFNTTVGDFALAGEYAFRDNLPIQVHTTDVIFAALQPAFPANDVVVGAAGTPANVTIPGRRAAVPDFIETNYRHHTVSAGEYIRGYERMKQGQADVTLLKTFGGDNFLGASQITMLLEMGHTYVFNFPKLSELQFQGAGVDTHISSGADGVAGINPFDVRTGDKSDPSTNSSAQTSRQNPTPHHDIGGFGTQQSYGYRFVTLTRFDSAFLGANIELLNAFFHDVEGVGPGIGQNFIGGRKQILSGIRFDYLTKYTGELRYTWFTGGGKRDPLRDRDNLLLFLGYQF